VRAIPPTLKVSLSFDRHRAHDRADAPHALALLRVPRAAKRLPRRRAMAKNLRRPMWLAM